MNTPQRKLVDTELLLVEELFNQMKGINPMFVFIKDQNRTLIPVSFHNSIQKDLVSMGIKELVSVSQPDYVVYMSEAWAAQMKLLDNTPPSKHPDRIEVVIVQIEFKTGEKFECSAKIIRESGPVHLDKFSVMNSNLSMGRFVDFYQNSAKKN